MENPENSKAKPAKKEYREWIQLVIILFATLIGAYEFIYKDLYKPSVRPTSLSVSAEMEVVGIAENTLLIKAVITTENPTDRRVYIPAFWFTVKGFELYEGSESFISDHKTYLDSSLYDGMITTYNPLQSSEVVAQKRICYTGDSWWEPKDQTKNEMVFTIPRGKFDYLEMLVQQFHTRYVEDLNKPEWKTYPDGTWYPVITLKGSENDEEKMKAWQNSTASGYNWNVTTLPLW